MIDTSQRVRAIDFESDWLKDRAAELGEPVKLHRKLWEFCVIAQVYHERIGHGGKVLGFGVGREPLASWFASRGATVIATDLPEDSDSKESWGDNQHASSLEHLYKPAILQRSEFDRLVTFRPVDMRQIPKDLLSGQFDLTWSCGSFEHIGSLEAGLRFYLQQLACLNARGVSVHTTEFNYRDSEHTLNAPNLALYRGKDLKVLEAAIEQYGARLLPLDLISGSQEADQFVDRPPYEQEPYHLNIAVGDFVTTSVCLADSIDSSDKSKDKSKLQVLWCGDAGVSTGFAKCTHVVCDYLHSLGHDVHVLGINYQGEPHSYPYRIYPCINHYEGGHDPFGVGRLPILIDKLNPDIVVLLNDPWNIKPYLDTISEYRDSTAYSSHTWRHVESDSSAGSDSKDRDIACSKCGCGYYGNPDEFPDLEYPHCRKLPPIIAWLAVDGKNQNGRPLNELAHVVVWTQFAQDELAVGGYMGSSSIVPLGVDLSIYYPRDKSKSRAMVCPSSLPSDAFIIGFVGRNQPRKRIDLMIQYFAEWLVQYPNDNAYLYLHVAPTGETGCNIVSLTRYYNVQGRVLLATPSIGQGESELLMPHVYSSFDVYLTTTQGEGWGLPVLEAMACGVPCVVPEWSGLGSWVQNAALRAHCSTTALTAPLNSYAYTIGGIPDKDDVVSYLQLLYTSREMRERYAARGLSLTERLTWQSTAEQFREVINSVLSPTSDTEDSVTDNAVSLVGVAHG